jgi:hypothetical protein
MAGRVGRKPVKAVTASTYTATFPGDHNALITNRGGGALTVTLPAPSETNAGCMVEFFQVAAGDFVITTAAGEQLVVNNNATADSYTCGTDNEEIGGSLQVISDGTSWLVRNFLSFETTTTTVTDA